jgi:hypothetical protein
LNPAPGPTGNTQRADLRGTPLWVPYRQGAALQRTKKGLACFRQHTGAKNIDITLSKGINTFQLAFMYFSSTAFKKMFKKHSNRRHRYSGDDFTL